MDILRWQRLGLVFNARKGKSWFASHAQNPTPLLLDERLRVYCNVRPPADASGNFTARITYVDLDQNNPTDIIGQAEKPVLPLGGRGEFDEFGTMVQAVIQRPDLNQLWLYYVGWTRKTSVPFDWAIGLAISTDGGNSFSRYGHGPVIGPTPHEPFLLACPHVRQIDDIWHIWYGAGLHWQATEIEPIYRIFHATSADGLNWQRSGVPCLPTHVSDECQTTPTLLRRNEQWLMLFSYRHGTEFRCAERGYRIGCAVSDDLVSWERRDDLIDFAPSSSGWDSEMVCYPQILETPGDTYMFYCGNGFGREGFGVARLMD